MCLFTYTLALPSTTFSRNVEYLNNISASTVPALSHDKDDDYISVVYVHSHSFTGSSLLA